jgi:adenosylmethionine-8-amino-7-oxononanoate aminotransferase
MKKETKDVIQYGSAVAMVGTAIGLSIFSFIWLGLIHASVLTYTGEAVGFACAVFGLTVYSRSKVQEAREELQEEFEQLKRELLNQTPIDNDETLHNQ